MEDTFDTRLLLRWAYDIAKGMEYLSRNTIMHGDLAARNVLICSNCGDGSDLVAKVADFGLAKDFYNNVTYKKTKRRYLPWKWMVTLHQWIQNLTYNLL